MNDLEDSRPQQQRGRFVAPDDLANGQLLAVHSIKANNDPADILGQAVQVTAVCLPFVAATMACNGRCITLDTRYINVMKVTQEFFDAQKPPKIS